MMMRQTLMALFLCASVAKAQDIEMLSEMRGRPLPRGYFEMIQEHPDAFELKAGWRNKVATVQASAAALEGTLPLVIIPALFSDSPQPEAIISSSALHAKMFSPTSGNTVSAYYNEVSLGKLKINGLVTSWAATSLPRSVVVGANFGLGGDSRVRDWIREAVANVDASIDFGQFDNDGPDGIPNSGDDDGRVDGAAFLFREIDASCGGNGIWPHRSRLQITGLSTAAVTNDPRPNGGTIVVDDYMTLGARTCSGLGSLEVNVVAHETGHIIGQPDYYDSSAGILREQRRWVIGCWEIMSAGSWGCGAGMQQSIVIPSHMSPFPKQFFGWNNPTVVNTVGIQPQTFTLRSATTTPDALRIRLTNTEYLFVEYRTKTGFDAGLPSAGILIYHQENGRPFLPCATCPRTYSYQLLEADGDSALTRQETQGGNRGAPGDAWGVTKFRIDDTTIPSTKLNNGVSTFVRISKMVIDAAAGVARVTVSLLPSQITVERLVSALGLAPLPAPDVTLMDAAGNANGRFDVGDFRAYIKIRADDP